MHYPRLQHFLHCELSDFLSLKAVATDTPYLTKTSTTNGVLVVEQVLIQRYLKIKDNINKFVF